MRPIYIALCAFFFFVSCTKELSQETADPTTPPLGNDCQVNLVVDVDSASGVGTFSRFVQFNQDGQAVGARFYDSINNVAFLETTITYRGDTMRINPSEYFLLDATKRVQSYVSLDGASNIADKLTIRYSYDGAGYLVSRELFLDNATVPEYLYTYSWTNGDLTGAEGFFRTPTGPERLFSAVLQYDLGVDIRGNLLPIPDAFEVYQFLSALNLGRLPRHLLTTTVVTLYDPVAQTSETFTNRNRSHVISSDGYIQEYTSYTEATPNDPADSLRIRLGYFCR
jgi:hypothetical protein